MNPKLITLDLDGTLLPDDTVFAAVLRGNGRSEDVAASDARYFSGETSLEQCFWEQWAWVQELRLSDMHRALRGAAWLQDIHDAVKRMQQHGAKVCLLTDQPSVLTDFLGRWGLIDAICSPVTIVEGRATEIDARFDKLANLRERCQQWGIDLADVCHVGNGSNDVPVWQAVGGSVAVFAEPAIAAHAGIDLGRIDSLHAVVDAIYS